MANSESLEDVASTPRKPRIEYIDLAKGFCICLVVVNHLAGRLHYDMPMAQYLTLFRMPLYYFLSGCFFKVYDGFSGFMKRKINKLVIPFAFFYLLNSCLLPRLLFDCFGISWARLEYSEFLTGFLRPVFPGMPIWFLLALFGINIVFYLIHITAQRTRYSLAILVGSAIVLACVGAYITVDVSIYLRAICRNLLFFVAGYLAYRKTDVLRPNRFDDFLWLQIIISFAIVWFGYNYLPYWLHYYLCGLAGLYGVVMLAKLIGKLPYFSNIGRYSIMLLVTHMVLIRTAEDLLAGFKLTPSLRFLLILIPVMASYHFLIPFMKKYMPHVTAQKDVIKV